MTVYDDLRAIRKALERTGGQYQALKALERLEKALEVLNRVSHAVSKFTHEYAADEEHREATSFPGGPTLDPYPWVYGAARLTMGEYARIPEVGTFEPREGYSQNLEDYR